MKGWLVVVIALGCVLGAAALPPGIRCTNPDLLLPASFMLLAAFPAVLGLYHLDTLRSVTLGRSRWAAATGTLRTFIVTWSFCLPVVATGLVLAIMQTPLPDQSLLIATGVAVLGIGALARLIGDGSADLHREVPGHRRFGRWLGRFWRTHPWVTVYLLLAAVIAVWASLSPLAC